MEMLAKTLQSMIPKAIWDLVETNAKSALLEISTMSKRLERIEANQVEILKRLGIQPETKELPYVPSSDARATDGSWNARGPAAGRDITG